MVEGGSVEKIGTGRRGHSISLIFGWVSGWREWVGVWVMVEGGSVEKIGTGRWGRVIEDFARHSMTIMFFFV
jgi:hypothetical protein